VEVFHVLGEKCPALSQPSGTFQELLGFFSGDGSYAEHMGMGRQFVARLAGASPFEKTVAGAVGIVLPVAAFGWFVIIAPAPVSFAVAVGAAVAWCAWLEKHPDAPAKRR
jgi:hypothetical protein